MNPEIDTLVEKHENMIFPSRDDEGIEHVDMNYKEYMAWFKKCLLKSFAEGQKDMMDRVEHRADELTEKIVIDYANFSGREDKLRARLRTSARANLIELISELRKEI